MLNRNMETSYLMIIALVCLGVAIILSLIIFTLRFLEGEFEVKYLIIAFTSILLEVLCFIISS